MVEAELALFQMQGKSVLGNTIEFGQSALGKAPERLNAVDMIRAFDEFIVAVIDSEMLIKANINQAVITTPAISMDDTVRINFTSNNGLQRGFGGIRHDFCVDLIATFEQAKDDCFASRSPAPFTPHTASAKVGLIGFKLARKRRMLGAPSRHMLTHTQINRVDAAYGNARQGCAFTGGQIKRKMADNLSKFGFTDFRTPEVPVFLNHLKKLACFNYMFAS